MSRISSTLPRFVLALGASCLLLVGMGFSQDDTSTKDETSIQKRIVAAAHVIDEVMSVPDKAIPDKIMHNAKCIAVIPSMVKIAVGFGGEHGHGVAVCRLPNGRWSGPAPISISGGSWGLQLGGQAIDIVLIVTNQQGMDHLLSDKFKIGAGASAAAGPVGRDASAATDLKMQAEILTYSRARGLFAGIDLSGSVITQDKDETHLLYGKFVPFQDILTGKVRPPQGSRPLIAAITKYANETHDHAEVKTSPGNNESASR
jgi:SH3 domain-containing YSC84-like protein 1